MRFSVVIVNYESWPYTLACLDSLRATGYPDFEVVVVDNGTGEPPPLPEGVVLIRPGYNAGFARACNLGICGGTGDLVILLNPDTLVERGFFEGLEGFFAEHPRAGAAGPRIREADGGIQRSARREVSALSGLLGRTSLLTRLFPHSPAVRAMFPAARANATGEPAEVDWVSGACLVARRETLKRVGGLDERFFMYFEDADLCRRIRGTGRGIYYLPGVEVLHHTGGASRSAPRAIWRLHASAFLYHRKHGRHGPLNLYSAAVAAGLAARGAAKLTASILGR